MKRVTYPSSSVWMDTATTPNFPALSKSMKCDVVIIGAGIAGLTTGYFLAKAGRKVVVLDKGTIGCGQTGRTTAHLTNVFDDRYVEMERLHGKKNTKLIAESHTEAINIIENICQSENIECDFKRVPGYLIAGTKDDLKLLDDECKAAQRVGLAVETAKEVPGLCYEMGKVLLFPDQGEIHALKYLSGLAKAFTHAGGKLYLHSQVTSIEEEKETILTVGKYTVTASTLVLATNSPLNRTSSVHSKQVPYRTYVIGMTVPQGSLSPVLVWDTLEPYHYVRMLSSKDNLKLGKDDLLIVGGEDHLTGETVNTDEIYQKLEQWTKKHYPEAKETVYRWSGQVMEPSDGVALIGKNPGSESTYIITGDSGNGMTHGTLGGKLLCDLILGKKNPWASLYTPDRIRLKALKEYVKGGTRVAAKYAKWLKPDKGSLPGLKKEEGTILQDGLKKVAVYRDEKGKLHKRSAVCPHMGCIVAWNSGEKSFDCPCHGSRFNRYGKVINGPALGDLGPNSE